MLIRSLLDALLQQSSVYLDKKKINPDGRVFVGSFCRVSFRWHHFFL